MRRNFKKIINFRRENTSCPLWQGEVEEDQGTFQLFYIAKHMEIHLMIGKMSTMFNVVYLADIT